MARYELNPITKEYERVDNDSFVSPTVTASATLTLSQETILVDATSGNVVLTLPLISGNEGKVYHIKKIDSSSNTVTVTPSGSDTIHGDSTLIIQFQYSAAHIVADYTNEWNII